MGRPRKSRAKTSKDADENANIANSKVCQCTQTPPLTQDAATAASNESQNEEKITKKQLMELLKEILRGCSKSLVMIQHTMINITPDLTNQLTGDVVGFSELQERISSGEVEKLETLEEGFRRVFSYIAEHLPKVDPLHIEANLKIKVTETLFKNFRDTIAKKSSNPAEVNNNTKSNRAEVNNNTKSNRAEVNNNTKSNDAGVNNNVEGNHAAVTNNTESTEVPSGSNLDANQSDDDDEITIIFEKTVFMGGGLRGPHFPPRLRRPRKPSPDITTLTGRSVSPARKKKKLLGKKRSPWQPKPDNKPQETNSSPMAASTSRASSSVNKLPDPECSAAGRSENTAAHTSTFIPVVMPRRSRHRFTSAHLSRRVEVSC